MASSLGPIRHQTGTVLPSLMTRVLKVRTTKQTYNAFLQKHFLTYPLYHVADPTGSCNAGDVIDFIGPLSSVSKSENVKHVVTEIKSPWGKRVDERPALWDSVVWKKLTRGRQGGREVLDRILGRRLDVRKRRTASVETDQKQASNAKATDQRGTETEVDREAKSEPVWLKFKQRSMARKEEVAQKDTEEERDEVIGQSRQKRKEKDNAEEERRQIEKAESEGIVKEEEKAPEGKGTREEVLGSAAS